MRYTYDIVEPYLVNSEVEGSKMYCEFKIPESGETIESEAAIKRSNNVKSQVERTVKRTAANQLRRSASSLLRQVLGRNMIGRTVNSAFRTASRTNNMGSFSYSTEEKQEAIIEAFSKVAEYFRMEQRKNTIGNRKISINKKGTVERKPRTTRTTRSALNRSSRNNRTKKVLSPFEQQLTKYPISNRFDQEILARMLVELANADGKITAEERGFLGSFISPEIGRIDQLLLMDPISPIECEEVSPNAKKSIYMLAWTISLIDYDIDIAEKRILNEYVDMFELNDDDAAEAMSFAKSYALEQALTPMTGRSELYNLAEQLELGQEDALRCQIQWKKRS